MEEVKEKKKRGRPRKNTSLAEPILKIIDLVREKEQLEIKDIITYEKEKRKGEWDVKIGDPIPFFDSRLSYELTGYKPIDDKNGLDFDPSWFMIPRNTFKETGSYCSYRRGSKAYDDFWHDLYVKCRDGMTVNGYTITGDNYFFLNFYLLMDLTSTTKAGSGRSYDFPSFFVKLYEYFHYVELCKRLRKNAIGLKARGVG